MSFSYAYLFKIPVKGSIVIRIVCSSIFSSATSCKNSDVCINKAIKPKEMATYAILILKITCKRIPTTTNAKMLNSDPLF